MIRTWLPVLLILVVLVLPAAAQNASTGAISGNVVDSSGALVAGAQVVVTNAATGDKRTTVSQSTGGFSVPLLPPGNYSVEVSGTGFKTWIATDVSVVVSETVKVPVKLVVGTKSETITVTDAGAEIQTESAELGSVTDSRMISNLPLAARNYLQIIGLNPGVSAELTDAGDLGRGSSSLATGGGGFSASGAVTNDNNFQMNGVPINDNFSAGEFSGGVPIPNPDTFEEFKVVTTPYDASNGRNGGTAVNVITKTGSNTLHGSLFEYLRNDDMNANLWFLNQAGLPRAVEKQNQFGGTIGGHILQDKLLFFGSYQGTRQRNGISSDCASTAFVPPLTDDRSPEGLGKIFGGQYGYIQTLLGGVGPSIASDGSNINPVALTLLQMKLPNGQYLIPTPQIINPGPYSDTQGSATFSVPCPYTENQYMANGDYIQNNKSSFQVRYFMANSDATMTLPGARPAGAGVPGFPFSNTVNFKTASVTHTYTFSPTLLNQAEIGFNRSYDTLHQGEQFSYSSVGSTVPDFVNNIPGIAIASMGLGGDAENTIEVQNTFLVQDSLAWTHGHHSLRFGGDYTRNQVNSAYLQDLGGIYFLTFADFLLGLDANDNGTAAAGLPYSNEYLDEMVPGNLSRYYRYYDASGYVQDDFKVTPRLTLNAGLRFEHLGDFSEARGINTGVDLSLLDPNPPAGGTLDGYVVPSNYPGTPPTGVTRLDNKTGIKGLAQNAWEPRFGFAWQLPNLDKIVLRGGYGVYRSRLGANGLTQNIASPPFASLVFAVGSDNAPANLQNPLWQPIPTFPSWPAAAYSPDTAQAFEGLDQNLRPPVSQHYSLDVQTEIAKDFVFDIGYGGARFTRLWESNQVNQAALASPTNPIRGETTNTLANIQLRVPYEGWSSGDLILIQSNGASWYNSLQASLKKRFSHGLQFMASYTWARDLTDVPGAVTSGGFGGLIYGDQHNLKSFYGPDPFIRPHRFVVSYTYNIPYPGSLSSVPGRILGDWMLSGVTTAQTGHQLFALNGNPQNAYGTITDRPDYIPGCAVNKSGSTGNRVSDYFNTDCFPNPPVIGDDGIATAFGNAPIGNIRGPSEFVSDMSLSKSMPIKWPTEGTQLSFRADVFNVFNHPVFGDPSTDFEPGGAAGMIGGTASNPRVIQLALKFAF
ncbi:MAG: TonB-dependent receptor [Terriglobales bacterium]